jgi:hypothetical protein
MFHGFLRADIQEASAAGVELCRAAPFAVSFLRRPPLPSLNPVKWLKVGTIAKKRDNAYIAIHVDASPVERANVLLLSLLCVCVFWRGEARQLEFF